MYVPVSHYRYSQDSVRFKKDWAQAANGSLVKGNKRTRPGIEELALTEQRKLDLQVTCHAAMQE